MLTLASSPKLVRVPAAGIMRTLGERPTRLTKAIAGFGRLEKTLHTRTYIDGEGTRRGKGSRPTQRATSKAVNHAKPVPKLQPESSLILQ